MLRQFPSCPRLLRRRCLQALPFVASACTSHPLTQPDPAPELQTDVYITVAPNQALDLVFMVDNSPSMAPKVTKMNAQFPKLIAALKDPTDGTLPDLRVAVIDSDLGTRGAYTNNSCAVKTLPDGTQSAFGDLGRFQMLKSPNDCTFNDGALFLEYKGGQPVNYSGDINNVFACLASNLGTMGCGEEHQLQAFEFALAAQGVGNETQQKAFLRPEAYLGLVFLTDEDDCSAAPNDGLFGDFQELRTESASLRCATRAHKCDGLNLADMDKPGYPTKDAFSAPFSKCEARMGDECSETEDTSKPTKCNPLKSVAALAGEMKALKGSEADEKILVAGIFGWPLTDAEYQSAEYKIAKVPNPNTADVQHPTVFDYWPVCYDPGHKPTKPDGETGFDTDAAGWGATGGLRNAAFVDQFGPNGLKFSICQPDFSKSMEVIGEAIAKKLQNLCVDYKLVDTEPDTQGVQADCRVVWRIPEVDAKGQVTYKESSTSLPQCNDETGRKDGEVTTDCWQLTMNKDKCPTNGQWINVLRTAQEKKEKPQLDPGTKIGMQCRTCTDPVPVVNPDPNDPKNIQPGCNYSL